MKIEVAKWGTMLTPLLGNESQPAKTGHVRMAIYVAKTSQSDKRHAWTNIADVLTLK
jgi:hypothetical protein